MADQRVEEIKRQWYAALDGDEMDKCDWGLHFAEELLSLVRTQAAEITSARARLRELGQEKIDAQNVLRLVLMDRETQLASAVEREARRVVAL